MRKGFVLLLTVWLLLICMLMKPGNVIAGNNQRLSDLGNACTDREGASGRIRPATFAGIHMAGDPSKAMTGIRFLTVSEEARPNKTGIIRVTVADVRKEPKDNSELVTQALYGTKIVILGETKGWYRVAIPVQDNYPGYIRHEQVVPDKKIFSAPSQVWITILTASLKTGPGFNYPEADRVVMNTRLPFLRQAGKWYEVITPAGGSAWIYSEAGKVVSKQPAPPAAAEIIATARQWLGTPYMWGGMTPAGIDCSGFTYTVFALHGITLPRDADIQYSSPQGKRVAQKELKPGDLVFFSNNRCYPTHVGIYLGQHQFIDSNSAYGVTISSLRDPYWAQRYFGAKRVLTK